MKTLVMVFITALALSSQSFAANGFPCGTSINDPSAVNVDKELFKKILEQFCVDYFDSCYTPHKYIPGTLEVVSVEVMDLDMKFYRVNGTHSYTGIPNLEIDEIYKPNVQYKAYVKFLDSDKVEVEFTKGKYFSQKVKDLVGSPDKSWDATFRRTFRYSHSNITAGGGGSNVGGSNAGVSIAPLYKGKRNVLYYGVQIKAKKELDTKEFPDFWKNYKIRFYYDDRGAGSNYRYRYILGVWEDEQQAQKFLKRIASRYPDAFVVKCKNGKCIY